MSSDQRAARLELDIACRKIGAESPNSHSSSSGQTYYDILGVAQIAGQDAIKTAYRKLAKAHHPDLNALDPRAAEHFARINRAYRVLRDARRRDLYDARLHDARLRGAADATVSRRGRAWRILGMVAGYSMLASVATAGTLSFLVVTLWDPGAQPSQDEGAATLMSAAADLPAEGSLPATTEPRLISSASLTTPWLTSMHEERTPAQPARTGDRSRARSMARHPGTPLQDQVAQAIRTAKLPDFVVAATRIVKAAFLGIGKTKDPGAAASGTPRRGLQS